MSLKITKSDLKMFRIALANKNDQDELAYNQGQALTTGNVRDLATGTEMLIGMFTRIELICSECEKECDGCPVQPLANFLGVE